MNACDSDKTWLLTVFKWAGGSMLIAGILFAFLPVFLGDIGISARATRTKALAHAKQIHLALAEFALDENGHFPVASDYSNTAFRKLFDQKFQGDRIFFVPECAWHNSLPSGRTRVDNDVGQPPDYAQGLERGENHFAYVSGLDFDSPGHLPLVADGFSETIGVYSDDEDEKGGIWEGEVAIVVRVDGSAKMQKLASDLRVYDDHNGKEIDLFLPANLKEGKCLNPW
jgi:hypothetical protein